MIYFNPHLSNNNIDFLLYAILRLHPYLAINKSMMLILSIYHNDQELIYSLILQTPSIPHVIQYIKLMPLIKTTSQQLTNPFSIINAKEVDPIITRDPSLLYPNSGSKTIDAKK